MIYDLVLRSDSHGTTKTWVEIDKHNCISGRSYGGLLALIHTIQNGMDEDWNEDLGSDGRSLIGKEIIPITFRWHPRFFERPFPA